MDRMVSPTTRNQKSRSTAGRARRSKRDLAKSRPERPAPYQLKVLGSASATVRGASFLLVVPPDKHLLFALALDTGTAAWSTFGTGMPVGARERWATVRRCAS